MDIKDIRTLIKMITETDITEFALARGEESITIKRGTAQHAVMYQQPVVAPMMAQQPLQSQSQSTLSPAAPSETDAGQIITSPIVGTFYRAPAPDAAPYVEVGQVVEKGQVLCIVEAMKLMNEIEAEYRCKIVKICKENAHPVEFGDTLFVVEPA